MYETGRMLYERGGINTSKLPGEAQASVEEDYQVCVRMLSRAAGAAPNRPKKKHTKGDDHV